MENIHWFAAVSITAGNGSSFGAPNSPYFAITKATPTLAVNPVNITYGTALANSQLSGTVLNGTPYANDSSTDLVLGTITVTGVPEPSAMMLLGVAAVGFAITRTRRAVRHAGGRAVCAA